MLHPSCEDTIVAIASALGPGARGIVRLSGPQAITCARQLLSRTFDHSDAGEMKAPHVVRGAIALPGWPAPLEAAFYLWPTSASYTGQPCAEIHTLGSPPLLTAIVRASCQAGARPAGPGEFTQRAFLAGKLDLTQAEAVHAIILADNRPQLDAALAQLAGGIGRPLTQLRARLLNLLADLEAGLDFVEEDITFLNPTELAIQLSNARATVLAALQQLDQRQTSISRPRVVITGWPNVGKSSLFNRLVGANVLVSPQPGTTRDYLVATWTLALSRIEQSVELVDTAGFEPSAHATSLASRATMTARQEQLAADLELLCLDSSRQLNAWEQDQLQHATPHPRLIVWTKGDLPRSNSQLDTALVISSQSDLGIDSLTCAVRDALDASIASRATTVESTATRCEASLQLAADALSTAVHLLANSAGDELIAAEIRSALDSIALVVGAVYTDDLLDRIFSRFCIGK